ncbi:MAG: hypothetical protein WD042_03515 [Phycisphaeraceae bacterium]
MTHRTLLLPAIALTTLIIIPTPTLRAAEASGAGANSAPTAANAATETPQDTRTPARRLNDTLDTVSIQGATARNAFEWWARATGIALVIDWDALAKDGIDPDKRIDMELRRVPAGVVLARLMKRVGSEQQPLIYETTPWYVEVMSKSQADSRLVLRTYDVRDLLHQAPNFPPPPEMDLVSALANTGNSAGGTGAGGGGAGGLFGAPQTITVVVDDKTPSQRGEELAELIRTSVEPTVWDKSGGPASISYFQGRLIVRAPLYVHAQIGLAESAGARDSDDDRAALSHADAQPSGAKRQATTPLKKISTVAPTTNTRVSGVQ